MNITNAISQLIRHSALSHADIKCLIRISTIKWNCNGTTHCYTHWNIQSLSNYHADSDYQEKGLVKCETCLDPSGINCVCWTASFLPHERRTKLLLIFEMSYWESTHLNHFCCVLPGNLIKPSRTFYWLIQLTDQNQEIDIFSSHLTVPCYMIALIIVYWPICTMVCVHDMLIV